MKRTATIFLLTALAGCNYTGHNQQAATDNALAYAKQLEASGAEARVISCNKHDTDGDGYLSCSFTINGQLTQVECAGYTLLEITRNDGCRAPKINLRTIPTGTRSSD